MDFDNLSNDQSLYLIYEDFLKYSNENIAGIIHDVLKNDILPKFIILQIKCKNITLIQLMWFILKKYEYSRSIINTAMIDLILSSFDDNIIFFEMFKWYEEFGYNDKDISHNLTLALYMQLRKYPKLKSYLYNIIIRINNEKTVYDRSIFFIHDEVDIIKQYFTKSPEMIYSMTIRCYQYNAINTLKQLQYKNKIKFFDMEWYLLDPDVFDKHMIDTKRNPFDNEEFTQKWIEYICSSLRWDYIPLIINKLTQPMWKCLINSFYRGYLTVTFIQVLFHQMKINNIPYEKLQSKSLLFHNSDNLDYLKEINVLHLYINNTKLKIAPTFPTISNIAIETTVLSIPTMLVVFTEKNIAALTEIIHDSSLHLSTKYYNQVSYIDNLLEKNQLGWDDKQIKSYTNFKLIMQRLLDEANKYQELCNNYNSFVPICSNNLPQGYQLRYINKLLLQYNTIKIKMFQEKFKLQYDILTNLRIEYITTIRKDTNTKLDPSIRFTLPENASIYDQFKNLIENSENTEFIHEDRNNFWVNELNDNKFIQNIVRNMLKKYHVPIQQITPILYNYYFYYATEEHFFLE
jgi:hypothetical protein